jgi:type VI secretion system ImpM family protein
LLGLSRTEQRWRWAACGKHPVAGDYFRLGHSFPTAGIFADWMERGYPAASGNNAGRADVATACGWRFWAAGERKNLACGLVRDSNDSFGRPYPLLVVGEGPMEAWAEAWENIPSACERAWSYIEYCVTKNIRDLAQLEREILNTPSPSADWTGRGGMPQISSDPASTPSVNAADFVVPVYQGAEYDVFHLNAEHTGGKIDAVAVLHRLLKNCQPAAPKAFFVGGSFERTCAVRFKRPLRYTDFETLWSAPRMGTGCFQTESATL